MNDGGGWAGIPLSQCRHFATKAFMAKRRIYDLQITNHLGLFIPVFGFLSKSLKIKLCLPGLWRVHSPRRSFLMPHMLVCEKFISFGAMFSPRKPRLMNMFIRIISFVDDLMSGYDCQILLKPQAK